jgi:cobalt-precorrin 5A hydrolase
VLSGHVGRGNFFTDRVAEILGAQSVVTTASDARGTLTVDILGRDFGWTLDDPDRNVTRGCAAVVNEAPVVFVQETGEPNWWPEDQPLPKNVRYVESLDGIDPKQFEILLIATDRDLRATHPAHFENAVIYRPKSLVLGLGCDRNTSPELIERGVMSLLQKNGLCAACVKEIASIDAKKDEPGLLRLSEKMHWPIRFFSAPELDAVPQIENPSEIVKRHVQTRGVAEPAALLAAKAEKLLVPKQIYTEPDAGRSMTFAVARIQFPKRRPIEAGTRELAEKAQ